MGWICGAVLAIGLVELLIRLPFTGHFLLIATTARRAGSAIQSSASDHWKQRAILGCARRMAQHSLLLGAILLGIAIAVYGFLLGFEVVLGGEPFRFIASPAGLVFTTLVGAIYYATRRWFVGLLAA